MPQYLIQLTPHDTFFFGTGKEFGTENQDYFVRSGYFPQQTTLLGMLRYQLLCQADKFVFDNNKIQDKKKAKELIGDRSFIQNKENQNFGKIKSLSPVFLMKDEAHYHPLSKEYQEEDKEFQMREISEDFSLLEGYRAKNGLPELWTNGTDIIPQSDIFEEVVQVGIRKDYEGKSNENAFYQQTFRKLKDGFSFAFYAEVDVELKSSPLVVLGGERKTFTMEVTEGKREEPQVFKASKNAHKLVLLSDAYIENAPQECDFAITDTVGFRCLQANVENTQKYYSIRQKKTTKEEYKKQNLYKSEQLELYKRGSVFYFKEENKMESFGEKLKASEFYPIGYNYFTIIKKA